MPVSPDLRRVPIESAGPVVLFAATRIGLCLVSIALVAAIDVPMGGRMAGMLAGLVLPWTLVVLVLALRRPQLALSPAVAAGDFAVLGVIQAVVPDIYGTFRFVALFFVAAHAHFQGERRGAAFALLAVAMVVAGRLVGGPGPVTGDLLLFYELSFAAVAVATALVVGRLRTSESSSRVRARELSRRTLRSEGEVRRRVAESIHDGAVQELIGLDMTLAAATKASRENHHDRSIELIAEARGVAQRSVGALREEIVDLGPFAFGEVTYGQAVEDCAQVWKRRYDVEVVLALEDLTMPPEIAGHLFRITQEAVVNACRHSDADEVAVSLRGLDGSVELRVIDDGGGFRDVDPLGPGEPGHLGLAAMRERAELLDGALEIETGDRGTEVVVRAPL